MLTIAVLTDQAELAVAIASASVSGWRMIESEVDNPTAVFFFLVHGVLDDGGRSYGASATNYCVV